MPLHVPEFVYPFVRDLWLDGNPVIPNCLPIGFYEGKWGLGNFPDPD